jgi:hypothetical protein
LGNHSLNHPCSILKGPYNNKNYTVEKMVEEIGTMNVMLTAIDNHSFHNAYALPRGETELADRAYVDALPNAGCVRFA